MYQSTLVRYLILILGCVPPLQTQSETLPQIAFSIGEYDTEVSVEIVNTPQQREKGLMFRQQLPDRHGMLFVFPDQKMRALWMKNTLIGLDAAFLDRHGYVVNVLPNLPPCTQSPCPVYESQTEAQYMLELPANFSRQYALKVGQRIALPNSLPKARQ